MKERPPLTGLYKLPIERRLELLVAGGVLTAEAAERLERGDCLLPATVADRMIENVIGVFGLPFAVAPNFLVDGHHRVAPLVVEEPSIVAGLSSAAKLVSAGGGFSIDAGESLAIGQIQLVDVDDADAAIRALAASEAELRRLADATQPRLVARGGGLREVEYFKYRQPEGRWTVVLHLLVDSGDAMGANLVNTLCERLAPRAADIAGGRALLKILSNLADRSLVTAQVRLSPDVLGGGERGVRLRDDIVLATRFADTDPYRAATHNKGILNGVDAVAIATGNDWRAIEAGAHAFAVRRGRYRSLTRWRPGEDGSLEGELTLPLKVGTVGGSTQTNPGVALARAISGVSSARELAALMAAVGLAQNFAALRALVTDGIQKGHMRLHARSVAAAAGAPPGQFRRVVDELVASGEVKQWKARELLRRPGAAAQADAGRACGKVILLGEHAAIYDRHALAVPIPDAVAARVTAAISEPRIRIPAWGIDESLGNSRNPLGVTAAVALIQRDLCVADEAFSIDVDARIPAAMGLGGSAALAVAIIRGIDIHLGLELDNRRVDALAFECEKLAHGTPSGIDNNIATYGETVLFTRSAAEPTRPVPLREIPPLVIAASGRRAMTKDMVAGVRRRFEANRTLYDSLFSEIDELAVAASVALRDQDYASLGAMMNVCQGYLNALEVSTPELERMIDIARRHGAAGAKLTGSGGGGSIVALCPGSESAVAAALAGAGYAIIRMQADSTDIPGDC